ncbi:GNAT family N-acetyltransferase [Thalassobacillus pellis]|uniref:GNAT family N-acetyltransferase n=1 Tax=Thalassobacillus pellis TaxID=748008 RepID=UPI0019607D69|nr:GNAT family N-acetyltransferase [Thalassobacillus pellis]MBM7551545.1 putative N-acetyltransferase YhbS [Thalassobacillus pellis]
MDTDMLVKLYDLEKYEQKHISQLKQLESEGIAIKRALPLDKQLIVAYIKEHFNDGWANEAEAALYNQPASCFIAVKNNQVCGFACYDATAKGYFGPLGVSKTLRGKGVGTLLTKECLLAMKEQGYGYGIIGWVSGTTIDYYHKKFGAIPIENSHPGVYARMIDK